jgi:nucleoside-diphosphate-sugar epimerase
VEFAYGASKAAAERLVVRAGREGSMETSIVRPGVVVYGPEDTTAFVHMAPLLQKGRWMHVRGGRPRLCISYVENLVKGLTLCGTHPAARSETFNMTDDVRISWRELISGLIRAFGKPEHTLSFPAPVARIVGSTLESAFRILRSSKPPPITRYRASLVSQDFHFSCDKAKRLLGYAPDTGMDEGLRRTVEWYRRREPDGR